MPIINLITAKNVTMGLVNGEGAVGFLFVNIWLVSPSLPHFICPTSPIRHALRTAECIVMLLGQVAVAVREKHGVIDQVVAIFQQRLFHPASCLDGNIVIELGKMAAKTGVCLSLFLFLSLCVCVCVCVCC